LARHKKEYIESFERIITSFKEVVGCYHTSGDHDYILKILVKNMEAYHFFLVNKLTAIEHIGDTHSAFVINELKDALEIPID
jgi:Lrp/AsnC family leucine-responsive transcriptional regulator